MSVMTACEPHRRMKSLEAQVVSIRETGSVPPGVGGVTPGLVMALRAVLGGAPNGDGRELSMDGLRPTDS